MVCMHYIFLRVSWGLLGHILVALGGLVVLFIRQIVFSIHDVIVLVTRARSAVVIFSAFALSLAPVPVSLPEPSFARPQPPLSPPSAL